MSLTTDPRVKVEEGELEGCIFKGVLQFLGVRYAAPPTGDLRWLAPQRAKPVSGIIPAKEFGPVCPQDKGATSDMRDDNTASRADAKQDEDCLFLNVWTSTLDQDAKLPVMFWIHGGGNMGGAGSDVECDGRSNAKRGVVVVTINYRLGAFGYMGSQNPYIGANFGTQDQIAALKWVRRNIHAFGGDPNCILLFGESAGAEAARSLMSCPEAEHQFHRVILESAGFETPVNSTGLDWPKAQDYADSFFKSFNAPDDKNKKPDLSELRKKPWQDILAASDALCGIPPSDGGPHVPADLVWSQFVDGKVIVQRPPLDWAKKVPVIMGCNANEGRYFLKAQAGTFNPDAQATNAQTMANKVCGKEAGANVLQLDELKNLSSYDQMDKLVSASNFFEPALATAKRFTAQGIHVYVYRFCKISPTGRAGDPAYLAMHTVEVPYAHGNLNIMADEASETPGGATRQYKYDASDAIVARYLGTAWRSFARTGKPELPDDLYWPRFEQSGCLAACFDVVTDIIELKPDALTTLLSSMRV